MEPFLVDLQLFLATWARILEPYLVGFIFLYILITIIYLFKRKPSRFSSKYPSRFSLPFDREYTEFYEERELESHELLVKYKAWYYTYIAVFGFVVGFMMQAWTESVFALVLIPTFAIGGVLLLSIELIIQRERITIIKKKRARLHGPEITDPDELKEVEILQRFLDVLEKKRAQEDDS